VEEIDASEVQRDSRELRHVAEIRIVWAIAGDKEGKLKSAADSYRALKNLIAAAEADPILQSTEHFSRFKKRLYSIDDQIAERREQYNSTISRFNMRLQQFPVRWLAGVTGFTNQPYFTAPVEERRSTVAATEDPPNQ
jgi:LemA protein